MLKTNIDMGGVILQRRSSYDPKKCQITKNGKINENVLHNIVLNTEHEYSTFRCHMTTQVMFRPNISVKLQNQISR